MAHLPQVFPLPERSMLSEAGLRRRAAIAAVIQALVLAFMIAGTPWLADQGRRAQYDRLRQLLGGRAAGRYWTRGPGL